MKRYKEIDIFRAIGALLVAMYHFWVVSGYKTTGINQLNVFLSYGGEIGVTLFFVISGFSIYTSLHNKEKRDEKVLYKEYIKNRFVRIYPQYIASICVALFLGDSAVYLASIHIPSLLSHVFLVHNFSLTTHGSISGVLWTMGVIFQFYLIAFFLYRFVNRNWKLILLVALVVSVLSKYVLYNYFATNGLSESYYFIYGRQVITALDNFVIGMCLAKKVTELKKEGNILLLLGPVIAMIIWIVNVTPKHAIYSNTLIGYLWHTITALLLSLCMYAFLKANWNDNPISKILVALGQIEYGIYLWHLLIANNLVAKSEFVRQSLNYGYWPFAILLLVISVCVGWCSCNLVLRRKNNEKMA